MADIRPAANFRDHRKLFGTPIGFAMGPRFTHGGRKGRHSYAIAEINHRARHRYTCVHTRTIDLCRRAAATPRGAFRGEPWAPAAAAQREPGIVLLRLHVFVNDEGEPCSSTFSGSSHKVVRRTADTPSVAALLTDRASQSDIAAASRVLLEQCPVLPEILESVPDPAGVFNRHRQLLLWNRAFEKARADEEFVGGRRPGDILGCVNAAATPDGCGTSPACATCGAARVLSDSITRSVPSAAECRIRTQAGTAADFIVKASPLRIGAESVAMAIFRDAGAERRRQVLERVFFHDLLNAASGIAGIAEVLADPSLAREQADFFRQQLSELATRLVEEIRAQQRLSDAEAGSIAVRLSQVNVRELLASVVAAHAADLPNRTIQIGVTPDICLTTDVVLLRRVFASLLRNALEASRPHQPVRVWCDSDEKTATFRIHNRTAIPEDVQHQIFQRSFTTKTGTGHGLGTYSAKLFTERYLGGRLSFASAEPSGTLFSVMLPLTLAARR